MNFTKNYGLPIYSLNDQFNLMPLNAGFEAIDNAVADATSTSHAASGTVSGLYGDVQLLQQNMSKAQTDIADINTTVAELDKDIAANTDELAMLKSGLAVTESKTDSNSTKVQELTGLAAGIDQAWKNATTVTLLPASMEQISLWGRYRDSDRLDVQIIANSTSSIPATDLQLLQINLPGQIIIDQWTGKTENGKYHTRDGIVYWSPETAIASGEGINICLSIPIKREG